MNALTIAEKKALEEALTQAESRAASAEEALQDLTGDLRAADESLAGLRAELETAQEAARATAGLETSLAEKEQQLLALQTRAEQAEALLG